MATKLILIIEDDLRIATLVAEVLREAGYATHVVPDLDSARAFGAAANRPRAIISDLVAADAGDPAMLATDIENIFPGVPLALMTGVPPNRRAQLGVTHDRVLEKPFELSALLDTVVAMAGPGEENP
jgi:DNA-binding NtrC family response regulator